MAKREIKLIGDEILRKEARKVKKFDKTLHKLIDDMVETMRDANGVGLAAPQVGVSLRLIVIGLPGEEPIVLINPEVVKKSGERDVDEGCLSVPGYRGKVKRSEAVTVKARDREWKVCRVKGTELLGQVLEHEIDHLNGVLYIDNIESEEDLYSIEPQEDQGL